jgi:hypothetical protein
MIVKKRRRKKPFAFDYDDIARITGHTPASLRTLASKGLFNPRKLRSLAQFIAHCILQSNAKQEKVAVDK